MVRKQLSILVIGMLMVSLMANFSLAIYEPLSVSIDKTLLDGKELSEYGSERLVVTRGDTLELEIKLRVSPQTAKVEDLQVIAMITGYEHSETNPLIESSDVFDIEKDGDEEYVSYTKWEEMELKLPEDMESGNYKLRIIMSNKDGHTSVDEYNLNIDCVGSKVSIADIMLSPHNNVQAGNYLIGMVRVRNEGEKDEDNVKVVLEIPELGVQAVDYIDELEGLDSASSEEVAMKIPVCTEEGDYEVKATVYFDDLYQSTTASRKITIIESDACELTKEPYKTPEKTIISIASQEISAKAGEKVYFPITVVNSGTTATTVSFEIQGNDWAEMEFKPSNMLIVDGEESEVLTLYVTPKEDVEGSNMFSLNVKKNGELAKQVPLTVNIEKDEEENKGITDGADLRIILEVAIVVLVIILVIIGLVLAFRKMKGSEEEDETQTYY